MPFQLNAKNVFLTYPQCSISKEAMLYYLIDKTTCDSARIGQEEHANGDLHLHAYLHSDEGFRTRDERYFDICGFHPNVQPCRKVSSVLDYVSKTGNYVDYGTLDGCSSKRTWHDVLSAETMADAYQIIRTDFSRDYVLNHEKLEYFVNKHYKKEVPEYIPTPGLLFNPDPIMTLFAEQRLIPGKQC